MRLSRDDYEPEEDDDYDNPDYTYEEPGYYDPDEEDDVEVLWLDNPPIWAP